MLPDRIEAFGKSTIHHGTYNERIYLMKAAPEEFDTLPTALKEMAAEQQYTKVFAKVPESAQSAFTQAGYMLEASIPGFYQGTEKVCFMSFFLDPHRQHSKTAKQNKDVLDACEAKKSVTYPVSLPDGHQMRECTVEDAHAMAEVYAKVFASYPFPITDPSYILETMESHVVYFGVWKDERLIALSSAEMDVKGQNVEMTDFATLPECRGSGLATVLLEKMEAAMQAREMKTAYTIARAPSFGMNITFARMGYRFSGQLINNTNIGGQFEDMNIWYKPL
jgi:beta-lysine N6-acetyltransferase